MKRKPILREEDISPGFRCPEGAKTLAIPLCNVCKNWNGPGKCKKLGESPDIYGWGERRDCPEAVLDTETFGFPQFAELYPKDTEKLLERQEKQKEDEDDKDHT